MIRLPLFFSRCFAFSNGGLKHSGFVEKMCLKYQWPELRTDQRYFSSVWKRFQHLYEMLYRVDDFITRPIPRLPDGDNNCLGCTHEICLWQGSPPTKELQHLISECPDQTPLNCTVHLSVLKLYAFRNRAEERGFPKKVLFEWCTGTIT